jgi:hypothetical protein
MLVSDFKLFQERVGFLSIAVVTKLWMITDARSTQLSTPSPTSAGRNA